MCMCVCVCKLGTLVESGSSSGLWVLEVKFRSSGFGGKHLYTLTHLASPEVHFILALIFGHLEVTAGYSLLFLFCRDVTTVLEHRLSLPNKTTSYS